MNTPASNSDTEVPTGFRVVEISREPVELYRILKFECMAASGGQAKVAVASGLVLVNGEVVPAEVSSKRAPRKKIADKAVPQ
jgi:ribosome-associated protein YbcJ (S4-like RNA binding protein)